MTYLTAHAGSDGTKDNTLPSVQYGLDSGADCVEVDVRRNDGGTLVLSHNESSRDSVPLADAFACLKQYPAKKMNCDLKTEGLEEAVYQLALSCGVSDQLIYSGTVEPVDFQRNHQKFAKVQVYMNIENLWPTIYENMLKGVIPLRMMDVLKDAAGQGIEVINLEYHVYDVLEDDLKQCGLKASVWTVNETGEIRRFLQDPEIINITTRKVKEAVECREELC
ncbi:MAG: glycerophosphodiester phosphodiesterase [Lactimicrobium sp.]|uniref:glycerophosphodiester phosphodiesterase n=1 Tax=Lactimicrobium sp. TaxID=2563780 RepID=UPI002F357B94